jgi:hypothetical protein
LGSPDYFKEFTVRRSIMIFIAIALLASLLSACGSSSSGAASAVESYLNALVAKDADRLSTLSCADWEPQAIVELDSFQAVEARLDNVSCKESGADGDNTLVNCTGKIIATYNTDDQELDLSTRAYVVANQGGEWLVCGVK